MEAYKDSLKENDAKFAIIVWIVYGVIQALLLSNDPGYGSFLKYYVLGLFIASLTAGVVNYLLQQLLVKIMVKAKPSDKIASLLSIPLTIIKVLVVIMFANVYVNIL